MRRRFLPYFLMNFKKFKECTLRYLFSATYVICSEFMAQESDSLFWAYIDEIVEKVSVKEWHTCKLLSV